MTTIATAAIRARDGTVWTLPRPARHHDILAHMKAAGVSLEDRHSSDQGFIASDGRFVDRREAMTIALAAGQFLTERATCSGVRWKATLGGKLFSEDIF